MKKSLIILACAPLLLCGCGETAADAPASYDDVRADSAQFDSRIVYDCGADADDVRMDLIRTVLESRASAAFGSDHYRADADYQAHEITLEFADVTQCGAVFQEVSVLPNAVEFRRGEDETGELILDNDEIEYADVGKDVASAEYMVSIRFCDAGKDAFAAATQELAGTDTPISVWIDGELISAPKVANAIFDGQASITGDFDYETAARLAERINSAYLPYEITVKEAQLALPVDAETVLNDAA